jgi:hypothetical protein
MGWSAEMTVACPALSRTAGSRNAGRVGRHPSSRSAPNGGVPSDPRSGAPHEDAMNKGHAILTSTGTTCFAHDDRQGLLGSMFADR